MEAKRAQGITLKKTVPGGVARSKSSDGEWIVLTEREKWGFEDDFYEGDYISTEQLIGLLDHHAETIKALMDTP